MIVELLAGSLRGLELMAALGLSVYLAALAVSTPAISAHETGYRRLWQLAQHAAVAATALLVPAGWLWANLSA